MKKILIFILSIYVFNLSLYSQDERIKNNIEKAKLNKGIFYSADGSVKMLININKIESYYKWIKTADTISFIDRIASLDLASISDLFNTNSKENFDLSEKINKSKNVFK